ncbi:MAG: glycosyltransferase family 39 protein, partial [Planctomycetota bacterium]|nr:glycosyltransferase family 39 protein [Planctomycetota bacterium]
MSDPDRIPQKPCGSQLYTRGGVDVWLLGLLILTVAVRLITIAKPLLGNFATKSVIYAMIARNWVQGRSTLWYPTLDCLRGPYRSYYMLEFPFSAYLTGCLWNTFGGSLEVWGRLTSLGFSVASVWLLYLFVRRRHGRAAAFGAGIVLALSPLAIVYGQDFTIEASLLFFSVATFYCLQRWLTCVHSAIDSRGKVASIFWLVAFALSFALLLLTKIVMLVLLLPIVFMIFWEYHHRHHDEDLDASGRQSLQTQSIQPRTKAARVACLLALGLAILPAAAWYIHAAQTASPDCELSGRVYYSVRHSALDHRPPHPLLGEPAFYRQLLDDLMGSVLTPLGFVLLGLGFLDRRWRSYAAWLAASAFLIVALPRKFHELNYYFMTILPPLCIVAGLGWALLVKRLRPGRVALTFWLLVAMSVSLRYAGGPLLVTPAEDRAVLTAAEAVKQLTEADEPIVVMHGTAIVMPYYCNRPAWTVTAGQADIKAR